MKNIFKILTLLVVSFGLMSCEDDRDPILSAQSSLPQFKSAPSGSYTVTADNLANVFETFVIIPPSYNVGTEMVYQLEAAKTGTNFAAPVNLGASTNEKFVKVTFSQINSIVLGMGASNGVPFSVDVRIKSNIKNTEQYLYSTPVTFNVTPFVSGPLYTFTDVYLIGNATAGGWDNNTGNDLIYPLQKSSNANVYSYTGYFAAGGFKIIQTVGAWDPQWGSGGSGVLSTSGGSGDIQVASAGYYKFTMDKSALTYTMVPVANPTSNYTYISMIGTGSGNWNTDVDLTKSTFDPHIWVKKNVTLNAGELKFRANHDWGTNWGASSEFFGVGNTNNAPNIPVTIAWTYNVYFNDITGEYTIIPVF